MESSTKKDVEVSPDQMSSLGLDECFGSLADETYEQSEITEEAKKLAEFSINSLLNLLPQPGSVHIREISSGPLNKQGTLDKRETEEESQEEQTTPASGQKKGVTPESALLMLSGKSEKNVREAQFKTALSQETHAQSLLLGTYEQEYIKLCEILKESLEKHAKDHNFVVTEKEIEVGIKHLLKNRDLTADYIMQFILGYRIGITEGYERHTADLMRTIEYSSTLNKEQQKAVKDTERVLNVAQQLTLSLKEMFPKEGTLQVTQPASVPVKNPVPTLDVTQEEEKELEKKKRAEKELLDKRRQEEIRERARRTIEEESENSLKFSNALQQMAESSKQSLNDALEANKLAIVQYGVVDEKVSNPILDLTGTDDFQEILGDKIKENKDKGKDVGPWEEILKSVTTLLGDMNMRIEDIYQRFKTYDRRALEKETMFALGKLTDENWDEMKKMPKTKAKYRKVLIEQLTARLL
ncbi:TPA_asm: protein 2 [Caladenia virus 1]|uniref:Protein 2 n=1 Tax=Caladenia virus 1 TaxID=2977961 RepID=A0A9N6YJB7_9RHAB|nr:TPA_asm: protein 2 [Caladenia virus 1]